MYVIIHQNKNVLIKELDSTVLKKYDKIIFKMCVSERPFTFE